MILNKLTEEYTVRLLKNSLDRLRDFIGDSDDELNGKQEKLTLKAFQEILKPKFIG